MKKLISTILCVGLLGLNVPINAETTPTMFLTQKACDAALLSGNFTPYEAKFLGLAGEKPVNGTTRVLVPLETDACVNMLTTAGRKWVVQLTGTEFRAYRDEDNNLTFYSLNICGNPVYGVSYPKPVPPAVTSNDAPYPSPVKPLRLDIRVKYDPPPATTGLVAKKKSHTIWYIVGAAVLVGGVAAFAGGGGKDKKPMGDGNTIP